jgi:ABC-type uncharacterized transport system involved in gliding motility auxiliary subunit
MKTGDSRRRLILGGGTAAGTIVFLAIIIAVQYIVMQHPTRWDVTRTKLYTLSPQSKSITNAFKEKKIPVEVLAFYDIKEMGQRDGTRDLLDQYRDLYPGFTYSFVDPDKDRAVALQNKIDSYPTIVIKAGQKDQRITTANEESVTNALMKLLRTEVKKVYFLKGHGELGPEATGDEGFSIAKASIDKQNYKAEDLILLQTPEVPRDASLLIIAGPKIDPMDSELKSIDEYMKGGGSLMVLLNPFKTPKLADLLKSYGIEAADDIVVDRMSRALGGDYLMPVITTYIKFPITKDFTLASFFPEVRSVQVPQKPVSNVDAKELALTSPVSWTINEQQLGSGNATFDEKTGRKGPISVMAVSVYTAVPAGEPEKDKKTEADVKTASDDQEPSKPKKGRLVVFGSSLFASNKFFNLQGNGDLFMNSVSWLAEDETLIAVRPKSSRADPVVLTSSMTWTMFLIPVILVPLGWIIAGIVMFLYRRRNVPA